MDLMASYSLRFLALCPPLLAVSFAADSTCKMLGDANAKIYGLPTHIYSTETATYTGGKPKSNELIYLNNATYIESNGKWSVSKATPQRMAELHKTAEDKHPNATCRAVREESVNGEAATLYSMHDQNSNATTDSQIWISKSRGVPLKLEMDMDVGGAGGKSHRTMRYEYKNVHAPPVAQ
jgi:hypothetical protein